MNFLVYSELRVWICLTTSSKIFLSKTHKNDVLLALRDANLLTEYSIYFSPKVYPYWIVRFIFWSTSTVSCPSFKMKKQLASSFCFIRYCDLYTLHSLKLSMTWSNNLLSFDKLKKRKWEAKLSQMNFLSYAVFLHSIVTKISIMERTFFGLAFLFEQNWQTWSFCCLGSS